MVCKSNREQWVRFRKKKLHIFAIHLHDYKLCPEMWHFFAIKLYISVKCNLVSVKCQSRSNRLPYQSTCSSRSQLKRCNWVYVCEVNLNESQQWPHRHTHANTHAPINYLLQLTHCSKFKKSHGTHIKWKKFCSFICTETY